MVKPEQIHKQLGPAKSTHEEFIQRIRQAILTNATLDATETDKLECITVTLDISECGMLIALLSDVRKQAERRKYGR